MSLLGRIKEILGNGNFSEDKIVNGFVRDHWSEEYILHVEPHIELNDVGYNAMMNFIVGRIAAIRLDDLNDYDIGIDENVDQKMLKLIDENRTIVSKPYKTSDEYQIKTDNGILKVKDFLYKEMTGIVLPMATRCRVNDDHQISFKETEKKHFIPYAENRLITIKFYDRPR